MIVKKNTSLVLLVGCLAISTFAASGCRTSGFKKPNMDALKFWKSPDSVAASKTPPPPARYFDPAPILEEQVAQTPINETIELNGQRFTEQLNQSVANNVNTSVRSLNEMVPGENLNASLTNAQQDFQTAMQDSANVSSGSIRTALESSPTTEWNDFELPADLESPNSQPRLNQSLAGLKKSIYDANGKLVDNNEAVKTSIINKLDQTKSSFPIANNFPVATKPAPVTSLAQPKINQFVAATTEKAKQLSSLTPKDLDFNKPVLPSSAPLANSFKSPAVLAAPTAQTAPEASNEQLKLVKAQVADANRQIEMLRQQLAQTMSQPKAPLQAPVAQAPARLPTNPASLQTVAPTQQAPVARSAQLKTPRFGTSTYSAANYSSPDNSFVGTSPTNILRAANENPQPAPATNTATGTAPAFPSTPYGKFAPDGNFGSTFSPAKSQPLNQSFPTTPQPAAAASFQTKVDNSMKLKASTYGNFQPAAAARKISSHVSNIDIPDSILNGSGSYAPGSVHQVGQ